VHTLDGEAHAHRKAMFNSHLDAYAVADVVADVAGQWDMAAGSWGREIDIFEEVAQILFRTGARWVGLPDSSAPERAKDMLALVDGFGAPSLRQIRARRARRRTDAWVIDQVRQARSAASDGPSVLEAVAAHRGLDGGLLDEHTAAVEIINLVRPLVAVSWLVSGMALAYDTWPSVRESVLDESVTSMEMAQETRRFHPFVPFLANRPTRDLSWDGVTVPAGTLLAIDVWGTNHDPRTWDAPTAFDPTRFRTTPVTPYNLIPQGGGDRHTGHRCPGEDLTLAVLMTLAPRVAALRGRVVEGRPDLRRMPPRPRCLLRLER
jgi:fatty-acid peroxygenase